MNSWLEALFLGILEGVTEFLPVSSTGHLIVVRSWLDFPDPSGSFIIAIQLGAILAVCLLYHARLIAVVRGLPNKPEARAFTLSVLLAFLPAASLGLLFHKEIKDLLFSPLVVAYALLVGGLVMIIVERLVRTPSVHTIETLGWRRALLIGFAQSLAMIPGTSRSGATIIGALLLGVERKTAAEFSFFLAIPTMLGAVAYDLFKSYHLLSIDDTFRIALGFIAALLSALVVVKLFIAIVSRYGFTAFGIYRILLGGLLLFILS